MRMRSALVVIGLVAGCAAPGTTPAPDGEPPSADASEEASATASPVPSPAPTSTEQDAGTSLAFRWPDGDEPTITRALMGVDESFINPGAVIDHGGSLHMYANAFTAWPGPVQVMHLVSTDGVTWEVASDEPILTSADVPFTPTGHDVSTGFVTDDGTWVLVFTTVSTKPWMIGLATAPGPDGPWTVVGEPVLEGRGAENGEEGGLAWPSVVATDEGYLMYFTAVSRMGRGGTIAMATSSDGLTWTRLDEPALVAEAEWELTSLDRPRVARTPDGYVMVYAGRTLNDRGVAWSDDGITWTRDGDAPAIRKDELPASGDSWDAALVYRDGVLTYYLEVGWTRTEIYRATAPMPGAEAGG